MTRLIAHEAEREIALTRGTTASQEMGARALLVNRTHRVVRERAQQMSARRRRMRSLIVPMAIFASMLVILVTAVWTLLVAYDDFPTGAPDSINQYAVLHLWFLPVTGAVLALLWFRRNQSRRSGGEEAR